MVTQKDAKRWNRLDYDERKAQILATAQKLFSERPYGSVSTTEIAEAAGVTRGLLHHYFGTKRDLYLEVVRELVDSPVVPLLDAIGSDHQEDPTRLGWAESVEAWMELVEAHQGAWFIAISAGETGQDEAMREILDQSRDRTATQVMKVLGLDDSASPETRALVMAFGRFAEEITREWLLRGRLTRDQARVLLVGSLPMLVDRLVPEMAASQTDVPPEPRLRRWAGQVS